MDDFNRERVKRAEVLTENLSGINGIRIPSIPSESKPVFMMYPLIFKQVGRMQRAYERLRSRGYGCSRMYKSSLNVILGDRYTNGEDCFPRTEEIAQGLLTLPCHPYVSFGELNKIIETVIQS
jgi:dTDP-4-amino-4,6-dideoxygalactose transaminase